MQRLCSQRLLNLRRPPCPIKIQVFGRYKSTVNSSTRSFQKPLNEDHATPVIYSMSAIISIIGLTYAAVPLYRLFCQATGLGGTPKRVSDSAASDAALKMHKVEGGRRIRVTFNADTSVTMPWKFKPQQTHVYVTPGETSLVFYSATNPSDTDIVGISTYNILPLKAGAYFNKIQCFCFEEQKLKAGEQVDMPVFFFLDPEMATDPQMADVREVTLSYTFFKAMPAT